jgi:3'-phosphoadenosine 5'-phosphosulfate sulfotransferase (PAPS reductase)/FAD synthetase
MTDTADAALLDGTPDFRGYHWVLVNESGGKDSQTMLRQVVAEADRQGYPRDRIVVVSADLGQRDEWLSTPDMDAINGTNLAELYGDRPGAVDLARIHAEHYGLRFVVTERLKPGPDGTKVPQDLLDHIEDRGMWPGPDTRYCTADMKRGPVGRVQTALGREAREAGHGGGPVRILNCMGLRAQESPMRRKLPVFENDKRATGKGLAKVVDTWLPIHSWTLEQVWADIRESGVPYAWPYDAGMPRLSCRFCVLAGAAALARAAQLDPAGARERAALEEKMGHTFRKDMTFRDIIAAAESGKALEVTDWGEGGRCAA